MAVFGATGNPWAVKKAKAKDYERIKEVTTNTLRVNDASLPSSEQGQIVPYLLGTRLVTQPLVMGYGYSENHGVRPNYQTVTEETTENEIVTASQAEQEGGFFSSRGWQYEYFGEGPAASWIPNQNDYEVVKGGLLSMQTAGGFNAPSGVTYLAGDWTATLKKHTVNTITTLVDYTFDFMLALCLGPGCQLRKIKQGKTILWEGVVGPGATEVDVSYLPDQPLGTSFIFHGGGYDQTPDEYLVSTAVTPSEVPAFPGICYIILKQIRSGAASQSQLSFEVTRLPNYLGLPTNELSPNTYDMNAAALSYALIYEDWAGLGVMGTDIDKQSFIDASKALHAEGQMSSVLLSTETFSPTLAALETQMNSVMFTDDLNGGKITLRLYRDTLGFVPVAASFSESNIVNIQSYAKVDWTEIPTHFNVSFPSRDDGYDSKSLVQQNPAQPPQVYRTRRVQGIPLDCVCNDTTAEAVMLANMQQNASPVVAFTLQTNRDGANLRPGDVVQITHERLGYVGEPFFVRRRRESGDLEQVLVDVFHYEFLNVTKYFTSPESSQFVSADTGAKDIVSMKIIEAPYWLLKKYGMSTKWQIPNQYGEALILCEAANEFQSSFDIYNFDTKIVTKGGMNYVATAKLAAPLDRRDGLMAGYVREVRVTGANMFGRLGNNPDWQKGDYLIFLNDEILTYETITKDGDDFVFGVVYRGLIDTVAADHDAGDTLYILDTADTTRIWQGGLKVGQESRNLLAVGHSLNGVMRLEDSEQVEFYWPQGRSIPPLRVHKPTLWAGPYTVEGHLFQGRPDYEPGRVVRGVDYMAGWTMRSRGTGDTSLMTDSGPNQQPETRLENSRWERSPVIFIYLVDSGGVRHYLTNSNRSMEIAKTTGVFDHILDPAISTATTAKITIPVGAALGPAHLEFYSSDYAYQQLENFSIEGEQNAINQSIQFARYDLIIDTTPAFEAFFTFDAGVRFAVDFDFNYLNELEY